MRTYVIEREIPGAGQFSPSDLQAISRKSCSVLDRLGTGIQWVHSYVTQDKIYCLYRASSADLIQQHAAAGGFPANAVAEVLSLIDPSTAEPPRAAGG